MAAPSIVEWLVMDGSGARCKRCGKVEPCPLPMPIEAFKPWAEYVSALHRHCPAAAVGAS